MPRRDPQLADIDWAFIVSQIDHHAIDQIEDEVLLLDPSVQAEIAQRRLADEALSKSLTFNSRTVRAAERVLKRTSGLKALLPEVESIIGDWRVTMHQLVLDELTTTLTMVMGFANAVSGMQTHAKSSENRKKAKRGRPRGLDNVARVRLMHWLVGRGLSKNGAATVIAKRLARIWSAAEYEGLAERLKTLKRAFDAVHSPTPEDDKVRVLGFFPDPGDETRAEDDYDELVTRQVYGVSLQELARAEIAGERLFKEKEATAEETKRFITGVRLAPLAGLRVNRLNQPLTEDEVERLWSPSQGFVKKETPFSERVARLADRLRNDYKEQLRKLAGENSAGSVLLRRSS